MIQDYFRLPRCARRPLAVALAVLLAGFAASCAAPPRETAAPGAAPAAPAEAPTPADEAGFAPVSPARPAPKPVTAHRHMVATANPVASRVGLDILRRGGNAVDAAVAIEAVLTLVEPQSSGIGGGGFLMHFNAKSGAISAYEGREAAPAATRETDFMVREGGVAKERRDYRIGGVAAAVPGMLRMLEIAHKRHGKLPWRDLFAPAIRLARDGFVVSPRLNQSIREDRHLAEYPAARAYFFDASGHPLAPGTRRVNAALADTLEAVARGGADAFYTGPIARDIAAAARADTARPGKMTAADLAAYRAEKRPQVCGPYRSWLVCGFGPPTSGGVAVLETLGLLERFDLAALAPNSVEAVHLMAEALRLADADRLRYVADPGFVKVPVAALLEPGYLAQRSDLIHRGRAMARARPGRLVPVERRTELWAPSADREPPSTTHFNVVDDDGNAVAMTSSIGYAFGSQIMVRGFMLNNHASDFSAVPRTASGRPKVNRPWGGKRPRSAQSPTLVFDGSGHLVLMVGSPGGPRIIAYVVKTLIGVLDWKLDIQAAISLPNRSVRGGRLDLERGTALAGIADRLRALGHKVRLRRLNSGIQGIAIAGKTLIGGADPRREGVALGD